MQQPPVLQPDIIFVNPSGCQLSFKEVASALSCVGVDFNVCAHLKQVAGDSVSQGQVNCRSVGMSQPGSGIILVEKGWIYYELSCTRTVFLVAATWVFLFRFCIVEVP